MSAQYPNVPNVPGVPAVLRSAQFPADAGTQDPLTSDGDQASADMARQWGLFDQRGNVAFPADNVVAFELGIESRISDYPVAPNANSGNAQTVGFASFNKVQVPYDVRLIMSTGGSVQDRQAFIGAVQDAEQSTDLFNAVTPECVYLDMNVVGVRTVRASDRGGGLLTLEIALRKVRQTATLTFTQTKDAAGASSLNDGSVQTTAAPTPVTAH